MIPDLERLIALQRLDSTLHGAERRISEDPARQQAFDARLDAARLVVATAKERLAESQTARRAIEKDVALHQGRLSKFREQAMAVKTNQEYHAVQHEIAFAESEIKGLEDRILENMLESDDLTAAVKRAEAALAAEQKSIDADRRTLAAEKTELEASLERLRKERADLAATVDKGLLARFDLVSQRRNGVGLAEAKGGICTICHVRLRPQVFNTVRRNDEITQCDSCNRILYFVPTAAAVTDAAAQPLES
jgi:predicted  nucleic acid-binding Zn-ribbon protein